VSIYHTTDTHVVLSSAPLQSTLDAFGAVVAASAAAVLAVRAAHLHRRTLRRLTRLSDHMLRDFGFERDWDGTILPLRDAN
jgi:hypothetical protein